MWHALLCMAAAGGGGVSMVVSISLRHLKDAMQQQRPYTPQPWEQSAQGWLCVEDVTPTRAVGQADMGKLVVFEGAEYGLNPAGTAGYPRRQRSRHLMLPPRKTELPTWQWQAMAAALGRVPYVARSVKRR